MTTELLERDQFLSSLENLLRQAVEGHGQAVFVSGEAGIGKTALVERFVAQSPAGVRKLWGACEALFTPRPLGPLYDIAQQAKSLRAALERNTNRATLFATVLDELSQAATPSIAIIEDVHWADEATLDLIKYLIRRISRTSALLTLTYRDDEIDRSHLLRLVLGDLPTREVTRLRLLPLSAKAVTILAHGRARAGEELYRATGGNPFFVTEALASDAPGVPTSVSDAVLARILRRSPAAQRLLEVVAIVPNRIERWMVDALSADAGAALEECLATGILRLEGVAVAFRHELARQAVESALTPSRRRTLHAQVLHALVEDSGVDRGDQQASLARLVHHAAAAEDAKLVLQLAPAAARQASVQGAHREAVAHYQTALRYADHLEAAQRAELLDGLSNEYYLTGQSRDAMAPCEAALAIWRSLERQDEVGRDLRHLSRLNWLLGDFSRAEPYGQAAVELLEALPPSRELAMAYANIAHLRMLVNDPTETVRWGKRAIALAERLGDVETVCYALNSIGTADADERAQSTLERSLAIALEHGIEEHVARAYANLSAKMVARRAYAQAECYLQDGIVYCAERDLGPWSHYLRWVRAHSRLDQGGWVAAEEDATAVTSLPWTSVTFRGPAQLILAYIRLRRGDPGSATLLNEARDLALATGALERIAPMAAARAEWRWLQGDLAGCAEEAEVGLQLALKHKYRWYVGDVAIWLWRAGRLREAPDGTLAPWAQQIGGEWQAAADAWEQLGCPYEQALALLDGDEAAQRAALAIFERLGARPAAEIARQRLRASGVRGLPRGPRPATQANPHGLTPRQLEILLLLAEGLHNSEIADRLSTTPKTVEHHVSAILAKLRARSRAEAVRLAYEARIIRT
jgi:DNA-binding CsgD family transcriptional regulator